MPNIQANPFLKELIEERRQTAEQKKPNPFLGTFDEGNDGQNAGQNVDQNGLDCEEQLTGIRLQNRQNRQLTFVRDIAEVIRAMNWDDAEADEAEETQDQAHEVLRVARETMARLRSQDVDGVYAAAG